MSKRVCPWWLGYFLASPLRRWLQQDPEQIIRPYVKEGMAVFEPGPGMGFFTVPLGRLVGDSGRVVAIELQPRMIAGLKSRLERKGLRSRVDIRNGSADSGTEDLTAKIDFTLAFAVVHELPSSAAFFRNVATLSKPGATLLLVEPAGHVSSVDFDSELEDATKAGFTVIERPTIRRSQAAVLRR
jgi:tRNA A58 N-methylase Trm61